MYIFFSDIHLSAARPANTKLFIDCLKKASDEALSVFILGDLFDFWAGDDDDRSPNKEVKIALKSLTDKGVELFLATGNRDFLLGPEFALETGAVMLPDYEVIQLNKERALVTHGDILCTLDKPYQIFRKIVRNKIVQKTFLSLPISLRLKIASDTHNQTTASVQRKSDEIMDVDIQTVEKFMLETNTTVLIHGHTHRPKIHDLDINGTKHRRVVLGDWCDSKQYLFVSHEGAQRLILADEYLRYSNL